jgi:hypothetical protein
MNRVIRRLLAAKGTDRYVIFLVIEDTHTMLPDGIYACSGFLLTSEDRAFSFWLDWDKEKRDYSQGEHKTYTLDDGSVHAQWEEEKTAEAFDLHSSIGQAYVQARKALGRT